MYKYCSCHVLKSAHPYGPIRAHTQVFATEILLCEDELTLLAPMQGSQCCLGFRVVEVVEKHADTTTEGESIA